MTGPLIELDDVHFAYTPDRRVLRGVDLALGPGERIGLIGPNGCGKTTLLHLVVGLLKPTSGTIRAFGKPRRDESDFHEVRRRAGLVFQDPDDQLFSPTVAEDVAFGPLNLGRSVDEALAIVRDTLDAVGLAGYEERITSKLSTGEKRLASLATVLAMQPEVLLMDEPIAGLDADAAQRVAAILTQINLAMVMISHDRVFLDRVTERTRRIADGKILPCGPCRSASRPEGRP